MATAEANIQNKIQTGKKSSEENLEEYVGILEENADAENIKAEEIKRSSEEDLESLLKLAEELKEKCDVKESKARSIRFVQLFAGIAIISYLVYKILYSNIFEPDFFGFPFSFAIILGYIFIILLAENLIRYWKIRSLIDKLALKEVLQLLREIHGTIAEREDWSILKRAEFRIRLSRFDLSEKKDSVFSFFS